MRVTCRAEPSAHEPVHLLTAVILQPRHSAPLLRSARLPSGHAVGIALTIVIPLLRSSRRLTRAVGPLPLRGRTPPLLLLLLLLLQLLLCTQILSAPQTLKAISTSCTQSVFYSSSERWAAQTWL